MSKTSGPTLEMLWEHRDPVRVLSERFGFVDGDEAAVWVSTALADLWGVEVEVCHRLVMSDRNALAWVSASSGPLLAKWSVCEERFPRLAALARLTTWLGAQGLPVSAPVAALDGRVQVELDRASLSVQRVVPGDLLDVTALDDVRQAGAVLARLHSALATYPSADAVAALLAPPVPTQDRIRSWLEEAPDHVPGVAVDALRRLVADAPVSRWPAQLVHGDFRSANVLCAHSAVAAVIDFEEARLEEPLSELARAAVLLGTRFRDWGPVAAEARQALLDGYRSVRDVTAAEARWWAVLVLWNSVRMIPSGEDPMGWTSAALEVLHGI
ncbi:phosphotransferase [Nocardioides sp. GY 10127]|uniref:phosphotransferase enzyme family protein n=1 Tax=Nocardioides sp. GY 10127 TaxID=2569762 RepID=UPI0010A7F17A|nr:phosphotransferase [Nocardioides sp. GY 10127]TIC86459.1 aminoglycoside phosphotransferase [Nocardioides sp. GY 10127]